MITSKRQLTNESEGLGDSTGIVALLRDPTTYDYRPSRVDFLETHISWVFLTDQCAYKLKKPVQFDFLDFSTSELRRTACEDEVRLNRRLARHVYLGVLPVTQANARLSLDGEGAPIDWVVKMRRMPAERSLDRLIQSAGIAIERIQEIARVISQFYFHLPPLTIRPVDYRRKLEAHVTHNRDALLAHEMNEAAVRRIHEAQLLFLRLGPEIFDHRVLDGRIVEGHGDLRPEHIYLAPGPTIIDCIEFNVELRQLDVLDELCFLAMECDRLTASWVGDEVISQYKSVSSDDFPERLAAFYKCFRACVRAKVYALRAEQVDGGEREITKQSADDFLTISDKFREELGPPILLIVRGLSGTGKTTLACRLSEVLEISRLETDVIRREIFGESKSPAGFGAAIYQAENRARVYEELLKRAKAVIEAGRSVIVDGTFLTKKSRMDALLVAAGGRAVPLIVQCHCPDEVARERINARQAVGDTLSESRPEIYLQQKELDEPDPPGLSVCHVDATASLPEMVQVVLKRLQAEWMHAS